MKVLRIIARLNTGGPARQVVLLDRGLRARGHQTLLVHGRIDAGEGSLEHLADQEQLRTIRISDLGRRVSPLGDLRAFAQLVRIIFQEAPDVIHTHTAKAGTLGRLAAFTFNATRRRSRRSLIVHTFHGHVLAGYFRPATNVLVRFAERSLAKITDRIVTISAAQRRDIVSRFRVGPESRTVTIPLGLDLQPLLCQPQSQPALRGQLGLGENDPVIGYAGRFVPIKDLATLIEAFAIAAKHVPDAWLVLFGDGPTRPELESLVLRRNLGDRVRFPGWSNDLVSIYATIDICALSSLSEGTPVAIIEAMAAGKAVVATSVGGVVDVIEDGRTGVLVPPRDAQALADAFVMLARDRTARDRLGRAARENVAARFAHERLVDDVDRLYASALAEKRGRESLETLESKP